MELSLEDIADILTAIGDLDCAKVEVSVGDVHIVVDKREGPVAVDGGTTASAVAAPAPLAASGLGTTPEAGAGAAQTTRTSRTETASAPAPARTQQAPADAAHWLDLESKGEVRVVRAPMVGTFYWGKEPGAAPFVTVGGQVAEGETVGLVEVMKLFHSAVSDVSGTVEAVLAGDGEAVEHGQPLVVISAGASPT